MTSRLRRTGLRLGLALLSVAAGAWLAGCAGSTPAPSSAAPPQGDGATVSGFFGFELLGEAVLSTQETFSGTLVGGLSSLVFDPERDLYYAISDDPASRGPARFYTLAIDLGDGSLDTSKVEILAVTELLDAGGAPFAEMTIDLEGLVLTPERTLLVSSEGQANRGVDPFIREFRLDGSLVREFEVPERFLPRPDESTGIRHNLGFESVTLDAERGIVYTATENALAQDGPTADVGVASSARILAFDLETGEATAEHVYPVEPIALAPVSDQDFRTRGLVELMALGDSRFLALERAYVQGIGNRIEIFLVSIEGASDVSRVRSLSGKRFRQAAKTRLLSLEVLGLELDNIEGLTFGPRLADGRRSLILISDNNFNANQRTQILALAVEDEPVAPPRIQGAGHRSPLEGAWLRGVRGTVTAPAGRGSGFWIQGAADGNRETSDAVRVAPATEATAAPGDVVVVDALVAEPAFRQALPVTTLSEARFRVVARGARLPAPVRLDGGAVEGPGEAGAERDARLLPTRVDDDGLVEYEPEEDAIDFFESLEGMRVEIAGGQVIGPTSRFGEIAVIDRVGLEPGIVRSAAGGLVVTAEVEPPPVLILAPQPDTQAPRAAVGDRFEEPIRGVIDYAFGTYRLLAEQMPAPTPRSASGMRAEAPTERAAASTTLRVATYNVENLSPLDDPPKFARLADSIVGALGAPDILALQEIQDDSGPEDDGTVAAGQTLAALIEAISAAGGPRYEARTVDPEDGADGGRPGANIRVAYLYRPDRLRFVERGAAEARAEAEWLSDERGPFLTPNPGRLDPDHPAFGADPARGQSGSRKPLAAEFEFDGRRVFLVNVHLRSKRGDSPLYGALQPPVRATEPLRRAEVGVVVDFLDRLFDLDPAAAAIVLGDFNEFAYRAPMRLFGEAGFVNSIEAVPEPERYTYIFRGVSQVLDHILISPGLANQARAGARVVHVNSDLPALERASDHDPVLLTVEFSGQAARSRQIEPASVSLASANR